MSIRRLDQKAFTIIELLIATSVLTVILLLVTVMITGIGNLYYKGITQSQTQSTTRTIADQLTSDLQLADGHPSLPPNPNPPPSSPNIVVVSFTDPADGTTKNIPSYAICIGTTRYSYVLNQQISSAIHVMWRDTVGSGGTCSPANLALPTPTAGGTELMGQQSRLSVLMITDTGTNLYKVTVGVAYGDDDLLTGVNVSDLPAGTDKNVHCAAVAGNRFCATDLLTTAAVQRVNGS